MAWKIYGKELSASAEDVVTEIQADLDSTTSLSIGAGSSPTIGVGGGPARWYVFILYEE